MLTLRSTLNRVWGTYASTEMSIKGLFTHYAYPTKVAHLFHPGRSQQREVQEALALVNNYGARLPDDGTELLKSLYVVIAVCASTPTRNPEGELQHRLNYIGEKMQWHIEDYHNALEFQQALNRHSSKLLASPHLHLDRVDQDRIKGTVTKLLTPDALDNQKNRVAIVDDNNYLLAVGYQNVDGTFIFEPILTTQQHEHQDTESDTLKKEAQKAFN